jgi:hypothetical protein
MKIFYLLIFLSLPLAGISQEEDADIEKLQEYREKQQDLVEKLTLEDKKEIPSSDVPEEIRKMGHNSLNMTSLSDVRVVVFYQKLLRNSPLSKEPRANVEKLILEKTKDSIINPFLLDNPKILSCFAQILQDPNAMADALGIFLRRGALKLYFIIWLIFMVMTWLLKRIVLNDEWPRWKYHSLSISVSLLMTVTTFTAFYRIFEKELSATISIILRNL